MALQGVMEALGRLRSPQTEERALQETVAQALTQAGIAFAREVRLGPGDRIDFLTDQGVGIEIKKSRPCPGALRRQLARYARWSAVRALVVIDQRAVPLPEQIDGKPCVQLGLDRLWGIAL